MGGPKYEIQPPQADPAQQELAQQASADDIAAMQHKLQGDTTSLLLRYGVNLAMAGTSRPGFGSGAGGQPVV